jgi:hypothetical protein
MAHLVARTTRAQQHPVLDVYHLVNMQELSPEFPKHYEPIIPFSFLSDVAGNHELWMQRRAE